MANFGLILLLGKLLYVYGRRERFFGRLSTSNGVQNENADAQLILNPKNYIPTFSQSGVAKFLAIAMILFFL